MYIASDQVRTRLRGTYIVQAPGCAEFGLEPVSWSSGSEGIEDRCPLPAGTEVSGRLLLHGAPVPDTPIIVTSGIPAVGGWSSGAQGRVVRTAADGTFTVPGRTADYGFRLEAVLPIHLRASMEAEFGTLPAPTVLLREAKEPLAAELGTLRLDQAAAVDVRIRNPDGTPPGSVTVHLIREGQRGRSVPQRSMTVQTDHRGRTRMRGGALADHLLVCGNEKGAVFHRLEATESSLDLTLDRELVHRIRLVDASGEPVAGARVWVEVPRMKNLPPKRRQILSELWRSLSWTRPRTDAEGFANVPAPLSRGVIPIQTFVTQPRPQYVTIPIEVTDENAKGVHSVVLGEGR